MRALLPLLAFGRRALAAECFCSFGENDTEPLWICSGGFRQYRCLRKARHGRWSVVRGVAAERQAPESYCTSERAQDACTAPPSAGLTLRHTRWSASAELTVEVTCPETLNCTSARGYLGNSPACDTGPLRAGALSEVRWIAAAAIVEIPSPTHAELALAAPFGFRVEIDDGVIFVIDPWYHRVWSFARQADGLWNPNPIGTPLAYSDDLHEPVFEGRAAVAGAGIVFGKQLNDALPSDASPAEEAEWYTQGQKAVLIPRSADASWASPLLLEGPASAAGFGTAVGISGDFAIVGSKHANMQASVGGIASIFERGAGAWNATPAAVIEGYSSFGGFGGVVAIDGMSGVAVVASPLAGVAHVFEQTQAGWSGTASALITCGALSVGSEHPPSMAVSGAFLIIGTPASEKATIFERLNDGSWAMAVELAGHTGAGALFGSSVAISDRGGGYAVAVVGAVEERRALLFERKASSGAWQSPEEIRVGTDSANPDGFGRSVAMSSDTIVVGSNVKKVYVYTEQVVGLANATNASVFWGPPPRHTLTFDARKLEAGVEHTLCVDFNGDGPDDGFKNVGLRLMVSRHGRSRHAEEL